MFCCRSISILFQSQKAEAARATASLNHCQRKCGDIEIPYPFGIKKGCYLGETFEATCNVSTGSASLVLLQGEIYECANQEENNCPAENLCVNTAGGYFCSPNHKNMSAMPTAFGTGIAIGIVILVAAGLWIWRKVQRMNDPKTTGGLLLQQYISSRRASVLPELMTVFKIEELEKATDKFSESRILGKGGLGTVYKGMPSDGRIVAVKKANITDDSQVGQFINEVFIISQIRHRHIVKLLRCCLETEVPLPGYDYVSNGTLSHHIHHEPNTCTISWENGLRIAVEVQGYSLIRP